MTHTIRFDSRHLRQVNSVKVFRAIREHKEISRFDLAKITGLSPATVSEIVKDLLHGKFIAEMGKSSSARGRPPLKFRVNPLRFYMIGVEIDLGWIVVTVTNFSGDILALRRKVCEETDYHSVLHIIVQTSQLLLEQEKIDSDQVLGIGLAVPGQVELTHRIVTFAPNLQWENVRLADDVEKQLGIPALIVNEAMASAMGEKWFGRGRDARVLVYVSVKAGLGAGIVMDRSLYLGVNGSAGEYGHMTIDPQGPKCSCGNRGCWETFADEGAVLSRAFQAFGVSRDSRLFRTFNRENSKLSVADIVSAAEEKDEIAIKIVKDSAWYLGIGIANIVNTLNPDMVIVGGHLAKAGALVFTEINKVVAERSLKDSARHVSIVPVGLGETVCVMGCIALLIDIFLEQPHGRLSTD